MAAGSGNDHLVGSDAANVLMGGHGDDSIRGGGGDDTIDGNSGDDTIYGDAGNDSLVAGNGENYLYGGDGDDLLNAKNGDTEDHLIGGAGYDVAWRDKITYISPTQDDQHDHVREVEVTHTDEKTIY